MKKLFLIVFLIFLSTEGAEGDLQCGANADYLSTSALGHNLGNFVTSTTGTVVAWAKPLGSPPTTTNCYTATAFLGDGAQVIGLGTSEPGWWCGDVWGGAAEALFATHSAGWQHLALKWGGGSASLYRDGVLIDTESYTGPIPDMAGLIILCGNQTTYSPDQIAGVEMYPVALSDATIAAMAASRIHGLMSVSPNVRWQLHDCPNGTQGPTVDFKDLSGFNRDIRGVNEAGSPGIICRASEHVMWPWGVE